MGRRKRGLKYVCQLGIILGVSFVGEALAYALPLSVPASVWGLVLMLALLMAGVLRPEHIRETAESLISLMPLMFVPPMFVPPTVGLMQSWGLLKANWLPFAIAITVVTAVVMAVTALLVQRVEGGARK